MDPDFTTEELKYLTLLSEQYPTEQDVCTEIINLKAILNLPKGTEHFMSDLHGEYAAFTHILNNCSGVIREKVDLLFGDRLPEAQRSEICTLIYYPERKLKLVKQAGGDLDEWYRITLLQLIEIAQLVSSKYTRSKVRKAMPEDFRYIMDELLHNEGREDDNQRHYHNQILDTIISIQNAGEFIIALTVLIKRLAVDRLHIVGDIFDRGPRPDSIMDMLMRHHSVDIQWGNHDILWMGAAAGSEACMATVVKNSVNHRCLDMLESGYGISLRPLTLFARDVYTECPTVHEAVHKAIAVILFKLEGQVIRRHPEYDMDGRLLLDKIQWKEKTVQSGGEIYPLKTIQFYTIDPADPYALSPQEREIMDGLAECFRQSVRLHEQVSFLYAVGNLYKCFNQNLLFHGCIPMNEDGSFTKVKVGGEWVSGKALMDAFEKVARQAYFSRNEEGHQEYCDAMYYLWCGRNSPLFGKERITTFERMFVEDKAAHAEPKNPYYTLYKEKETCEKILREFGLTTEFSHIINGHVPVKVGKGESPIKAGGKLIVIDGGFCRAYQKTTGIAGYTLIYNSRGMRIVSHQPFQGLESALEDNIDIESHSELFETEVSRVMVMDTDIGNELSDRVYDLSRLLAAYRGGLLAPHSKNG